MCKCQVNQEICDELVSLAEKFDATDNWLRRYMEYLDILILDHELLLEDTDGGGWKIHFAVDYYDIHGFLLPFDELLAHYEERKYDRSFRRETTLDYLARMCLFTRLAPNSAPVLIPPYLIEFTHRLLTYSETKLAKRNIDDYLNTLWNELKGAIGDLAGAIEELDYQAVDDIPDSKLMELLLDKYPDLVLIARAEGLGLYERMQILLGSGIRSVPVGHRLANQEYDAERVEFWEHCLFAVKKGRGAIQTLRDAQALTTVEMANESAKQAGVKELYFLISGSHDVIKSVERARMDLNWELTLPNGQRTSILRPLQMFLVYLKHVGGATKSSSHAATADMLASMRKARQECKPLEATCKETRETLAKCPRRNAHLGTGGQVFKCELASSREKIERSIEDAEQLKNEFENAQLILSENPDFVTFTSKVIKSETPELLEQTVTHVIRRMLKDRPLRRSIEKHIDNLRNQIVRNVAGLNAQIDAYTRQLQPDMVAYLLEAPFHIHFKTEALREELASFFKDVERIAASNDIEGIEKQFSKLMTYVFTAELVPYEKELVELIILLAFSRNGLAARLANACSSLDVGELRREFAYLGIRALLRFDWEPARDRCSSALRKYSNDPRFHYLAGYFSWREYDKTGDVRALENALARTRKSIKLTEDTDTLFLDEMDNLAYFSCEAGKIGDALEAVEKLKAAGIGSSHSNWFETIGKVYRAVAESELFDLRERVSFATKSVTAYEKCLQGFLTDQERKRVVKALREAQQLQCRITGELGVLHDESEE